MIIDTTDKMIFIDGILDDRLKCLEECAEYLKDKTGWTVKISSLFDLKGSLKDFLK